MKNQFPAFSFERQIRQISSDIEGMLGWQEKMVLKTASVRLDTKMR